MALGFTYNNKANHIKGQINHKPKSRYPEEKKNGKRPFMISQFAQGQCLRQSNKKTSILWILKTFKSDVLQRRLGFPQKKLKTMRSQNVGGKTPWLLWKMQKWRMVFSFKINECVSRLTSLYVVPFTYKLYFTQVIFTVHMVLDR